MRIVQPSVELLAYTQLPPKDSFDGPWGRVEEHCKTILSDPCSEMSRVVERCGRVSWKSEGKIAPGSADGFMTRVVHIRKDESIAEHCSATILFVTDRYVTHQIVRHRLAAYTQESTHYINYGAREDDLAVCAPMGIVENSKEWVVWRNACEMAIEAYLLLVKSGVKHYHARYALPGCLKTEIAVTYNLRVWKHVLGLRTTPNNTPEIVHVMKLAGHVMADLCPEMFSEYAKQPEVASATK